VFFPNDDTGTLAHDEAVPVLVIGARALSGRVVEAGRERPAGGEAGQRQAVDRGFGAARDHDVGIAEYDEPGRVADGVRAGGTGGDDRVVRPFEAVFDRDVARSEIDEAARNEEGADAARAFFGEGD